MNGVVNAFKPPGWSSHDLVQLARRCWGIKKVGHAGTLDPGAAGVLLLLLGRGTRLQEYLMPLEKVYYGEVTFGIGTDTGDGFGEVTHQDANPPTDWRALANVLPQFVGAIEQTPPMASALKHQGVPLYRLAQRGQTVPRKSRTVEVYNIELIDYRLEFPPRALLRVQCGAGTYIRTLFQDLAGALGTSGYMSLLLRSRIGHFDVSTAQFPANFPRVCVHPLGNAVSFLRKVVLDWPTAFGVLNGRSPHLHEPDGLIRLMSPDGQFLAIAEVGAFGTRLRKVFAHKDELNKGGGDSN